MDVGEVDTDDDDDVVNGLLLLPNGFVVVIGTVPIVFGLIVGGRFPAPFGRAAVRWVSLGPSGGVSFSIAATSAFGSLDGFGSAD